MLFGSVGRCLEIVNLAGGGSGRKREGKKKQNTDNYLNRSELVRWW